MKINERTITSQFKNIISQKNLENLASDAKRFRVFDPLTTLQYFLFQVLNSASCQTALTHFNAKRIKQRNRPVSLCSSAFTRAKAKLSEKMLFKIAVDSGEFVSKSAKKWKWKGRDVFLGDGTIITMADTKLNNEYFPKSTYKGEEVGFPKLRLLSLFCASSGAFIDGCISKYSGKGQSEPSQLLTLIDKISAGSVLILDRFFTSPSMQVILQCYGIEYVIRGRDDFCRKLIGRRSDYVVHFDKKLPEKTSIYFGIEHEEKVKFRIIKSRYKREGFRDKEFYIITSLFKEKRDEVEKLYLDRWNVELDIRNFKITLGSDHINGKSPESVRKEIWVRALGYNMIRNLTVEASKFSNSGPRKRSFRIAKEAYYELVGMQSIEFMIEYLKVLAKEELTSKYRREPRAIKRRKNNFPLLTTSRCKAQNQDWGYERRRPWKGPRIEKGALNAVS